jgi:hypothetical protein
MGVLGPKNVEDVVLSADPADRVRFGKSDFRKGGGMELWSPRRGCCCLPEMLGDS